MSAPPPVRIALTIAACVAGFVPSSARAWRDASTTAEYAQDVPVRWQGASVALQIVDNGPVAFADMQVAVIEAVAVWTAARCPSVTFDVLATPGVAPASGDRRVTISWITRGWTTLGFSADAAASTDLAYLRPAGSTWSIVDADIFLNGETVAWAVAADDTGPRLESTIAHEIGHVLALRHSCGLPGSEDVADGAAVCSPGDEYADSVMNPTYSSLNAALSEDEELAICAIFAPRDCTLGGSGCPPVGTLGVGFVCASDDECASGACLDASCVARCDTTTPCPEFESCVDDTGTRGRDVCLSRLSSFGTTCGRGDECVSSLCLTTGGDSYCTQRCDTALCPSGFYCNEVDGMQVCRLTRAPAGGCSVVPARDRGSSGHWMGFLLALSVSIATFRRGRRLPRGVAAMGALSTLVLAAACGGKSATPSEDGGPPPDRADLGPVPTCSDPGATRIADCGNCGTRSEECVAGLWAARSMCLGEGECAAAAVDTETTPTCAQRQRLCTATCAWGAWDDTAPSMGECENGATRNAPSSCPTGMVRGQVCTAACAWEDAGDCVWPCGVAPPAWSHWDKEILCVPGGPFMRGGSPAEAGEEAPAFDSLPLAEVRVSAFFIDRYPVTNRRYAACVDAGACLTRISGGDWRLPERAEFPFTDVFGSSSLSNARTLCGFEGGRLPTAAEWEKTARGAAPDLRERPWEPRGSVWDCDALPIPDPPCLSSAPGDAMESVRSFPRSASPFGAELLIGGVGEWVSDLLDQTYYSQPGSRDDPQGPASGLFVQEVRGESRALVTPATRLSKRHTLSTAATGFRCARSAI